MTLDITCTLAGFGPYVEQTKIYSGRHSNLSYMEISEVHARGMIPQKKSHLMYFWVGPCPAETRLLL